MFVVDKYKIISKVISHRIIKEIIYEAGYYMNFVAKGTNSYGGIVKSSYEAFVFK